jgi:hypothetical protein
MAKGSVGFGVTDTTGRPVAGRLRVELTPQSGTSGGQRMAADFDLDGHDALTVTGIACAAGQGTLYRIRLTTRAFRPYSFFQLVHEGTNRSSEADIRLMVNPKKVQGITAPPFAALPAAFRAGFGRAEMTAIAPEDRPLVGLSGGALFDALGPLRQACVLNLAAKTAHASGGRVARFLHAPTIIRQDRCFAVVAPEMPDALRASDLFKSAPSILHEPPRGFDRLDSFKTKESQGNLQVTFMRRTGADVLWADLDIDLASGFEHGFEVIENTLTDGRTNPYTVRDLLLIANTEPPIRPGYDVELA